MKPVIQVVGEDRTQDWLAEVEAAVAAHPSSGALRTALEQQTAGALTRCADEAEYLAVLIRLLRDRDQLVTGAFDVPHRNTWAGRWLARIKKRLWSLFRYQHDYMSGQQNDINFVFGSVLECQHRRHEATVQRLEQRIAELEARLNQGPRDE